ncbi:hypothetical protein BS50DRAFT_479998 [Corynespora cassiicola Philippines]|uniref:RING-type domain-containing protein n=1 Tax=Corynespora cassiicola Philippines TaxID=1448308 RepID=A0A2T2PBA7_CORCC|nr:hypothetical protein BS50DRAFT_479998 [Corynespora cassiicola Philippines]
MDDFLDTQLLPTEACIVCTETFSSTHQPVALRCNHILGYSCLKKWIRSGHGNTNACPFCRQVIFETPKSRDTSFDPPSIWKALNEQPTERRCAFMSELWKRQQTLWTKDQTGNFSVTSLLNEVVIPSLAKIGNGESNPFTDCRDLVFASWRSLGRPNAAHGLAVPLVRLARLMSQASSIMPKWLTSVQRMNVLFWEANSCFGLSATTLSWNHLIEAAHLNVPRYFPLLHVYTVLVSQNIVHNPEPREWPKKRHEVMNLVVDRCVKRIGWRWEGKPSNDFKDMLVFVYEELRRHQLDGGRLSLRGREGEENVVKGLWGMAAWTLRKNAE